MWLNNCCSDSVVYTLKDLVPHCVIVGKTKADKYGGYPKGNPVIPQEHDVYICDLAGLQFQQVYNSGRLVLIRRDTPDTPKPQGMLDDFIFKNTVGEEKKTLKQMFWLQNLIPSWLTFRY